MTEDQKEMEKLIDAATEGLPEAPKEAPKYSLHEMIGAAVGPFILIHKNTDQGFTVYNSKELSLIEMCFVSKMLDALITPQIFPKAEK